MSDHQGRRLGHRSEVQPCALGQRRGAGLAGHEHVVTGPLASMRERHEWAEATRAPVLADRIRMTREMLRRPNASRRLEARSPAWDHRFMASTQKLQIEGRLRVIETTGAWGVYAGERIVIGPGESFRDDLGIKIRETFQEGAAAALREGGSPSERFELPNVRVTIEVVEPAPAQ
jgi:hypothetical protein